MPESSPKACPDTPKAMRHVVKLLAIGVLVCLLAAGGLGALMAGQFLDTPAETPGREELVDIPPGASLSRIATLLEDRGIITSSLKFRLLARYKNVAGNLQAGRFLFNTGWLPERVLDTLVNGHPVLTRVTVPEGLTYWQTAQLLADAGFAPYAELVAVARDRDFLLHHGIPFDTAEGFLMPDTYLLRTPDDETAKDPKRAWKVMGRLVDTFWKKAETIWPDGKRPSREELKKYVILASIVEKETAVPSERPRVAGVYQNRLDRGMLLQADPTIIYGKGENFKGPITKSMLADAKNPYNTYQIAGLPPGPICSFAASALAAAVAPESHDFLFFVAVRDGGEHRFSKTLGEHNRAVREYRKTRASR